jgi:hypothetical protein
MSLFPERYIIKVTYRITTNNIHSAPRHDWENVDFTSIKRLDGFLDFSSAHKAFVVKRVHKAVENFNFECWIEETPIFLPRLSCVITELRINFIELKSSVFG